MPQCFKPWIDENTRVLIIGTMPSIASLNADMYYAHPQNKFWPYMAQILNGGQALESATERQQLLLSHGIGLWDALAFCERNGSLDSDIRNAKPNDFCRLPHIKHYLFNGQKAFQFFKRYNGTLLTAHNHTVLPSTSPANASIKDDVKFSCWQSAVQTCLKYI